MNHKLFKTNLRTEATYAKIQKWSDNNQSMERLHQKITHPLKEYNHWVIIEDDFPWDAIADVHHLLFPKRVFPTKKQINEEEQLELDDIIENEKEKYSFYVFKFDTDSGENKSVPGHFHIHFIKVKYI